MPNNDATIALGYQQIVNDNKARIDKINSVKVAVYKLPASQQASAVTIGMQSGAGTTLQKFDQYIVQEIATCLANIAAARVQLRALSDSKHKYEV